MTSTRVPRSGPRRARIPASVDTTAGRGERMVPTMRSVHGPGALALVALAGCRGSHDTQPQAQPTPSWSATSPRDAGSLAPNPVDAAAAPAVDHTAPPFGGAAARGQAPLVDAGSDARLAGAPAWPVAPGAEVPGFGCIGWSRKRGVLACILGMAFSDSGIDVSLGFVPVRADAEPIEPLALVEHKPGLSPPPFPPDKIAPFNSLLRGFTPLDRGAPWIEASWAGDELIVSPPITAGGATLALQLGREGRMIVAPKYRAKLWIRFAGHPRLMIEDVADAISHVDVRLFTVGGAVIVERIYSVGDEGTYGTFIQLWRCTADRCDEA